MRILFITHIKTNPKHWTRLGDMKMAYEMCRQLGDIHDIDVVGDFSKMTEEEKDFLRTDMHAHELLDMSAFVDNARYINKMFQNLCEDNRLQAYDLVHVHTSKMNIVSAAMKFCRDDQPIVVSFHSPPESLEMMRFYRDDMIKFCQSPNHSFICNSKTHRERCIKVLNVSEESLPSLTYVYNGIKDIYEVTDKPAFTERTYAAGSISRINGIKSAYQTLVFMHKLSDKTNKRCFFIGNIGEYERGKAGQEYYEQCLPLLEDDRIEWIKSMSPADIAEKFRDTDVNVYFGRVETFGLPILEAGLVGVPSLVLDVNGPSEIVEDGKNGFKHPVTKPIKWKAIYEDCLRNYDKCLKIDPQSVRDYTLEKFPVSNLGKSINEIYEKVGGTR